MPSKTRILVVGPLIRRELLRYWHDSHASQAKVADQFHISRRKLQYVLRGQRPVDGEVCGLMLARMNPTAAVELLAKVRVSISSGALGMILLPFFPELAVV